MRHPATDTARLAATAPTRAAFRAALSEVAAGLPPGAALDLPSLSVENPLHADVAQIADAIRHALSAAAPLEEQER